MTNPPDEWHHLFSTLEAVFSNVATLLRDCDAMLDKRRFKVDHSPQGSIGAEQSTSLSLPSWWYPGWMSRFYFRKNPKALVYVAVLLHNRRGDDMGKLVAPVVTAGALRLPKNDWSPWMAKAWAWQDGERVAGTPVEFAVPEKAGGGTATVFARPLAAMTDAAILEREVIDRLVALAG